MSLPGLGGCLGLIKRREVIYIYITIIFFKANFIIIKGKDSRSWQWIFAKYSDVVRGPAASRQPGKTDLKGSWKKLCLGAQKNFRGSKWIEAWTLGAWHQEAPGTRLSSPRWRGCGQCLVSRHSFHVTVHYMECTCIKEAVKIPNA